MAKNNYKFRARLCVCVCVCVCVFTQKSRTAKCLTHFLEKKIRERIYENPHPRFGRSADVLFFRFDMLLATSISYNRITASTEGYHNDTKVNKKVIKVQRIIAYFTHTDSFPLIEFFAIKQILLSETR